MLSFDGYGGGQIETGLQKAGNMHVALVVQAGQDARTDNLALQGGGLGRGGICSALRAKPCIRSLSVSGVCLPHLYKLSKVHGCGVLHSRVYDPDRSHAF